MTSPHLWVVRAGRGGVAADRFLEGEYIEVSFGAKSLGASAKGMSREQLVERLRELQPEGKPGRLINTAGQLFRFYEEMAIGDDVLTYDAEQRRYLFGSVAGGAEHVPEHEGADACYRRRVKWSHRVDRDQLSVETRNTLGSILTLFRPSEEAAAEVRACRVSLDAPPALAVDAKPPGPAQEAVVLDEIGVATEQKSHDFIEDRIARLDPYQMQDLVAGTLRAMGYKSRVSPPGPDGGHDIFASPDGLGLQEPRIFVEVKPRTAQMGAPAIRAFLGGRRPGDRSLYVSTGGYTKDARAEAARASVPLTLVDLRQLRELVVDFYEKLDPETKQLVPLRRLYWPIELTE